MIETIIEGVPLRFETSPTLFSPKRPDPGTLAMLSRVTFAADDKVLDLGCGYGLVGIYAAKRIGAERIFMLDADADAIACARRNLGLNGVEGVHLAISEGFRDFKETDFTKILCNPPYHADFAVAKQFIEKGFNRLVIGGCFFLVTKRETWYRNKLTAIFGACRVEIVDSYLVLSAIRKTFSYAKR